MNLKFKKNSVIKSNFFDKIISLDYKYFKLFGNADVKIYLNPS